MNLFIGNISFMTWGHVAIMISSTVLLLACSKRRRDHFPMAPGKLPLIGHALALADSDKFSAVITKWIAGIGRKEGVFEFNLLGNRWIVLCSTETIMACMKLRPFKIQRAKLLTRAIQSLHGDGLFASEGDQWRQERRIVAPALNHNHVRDFFPSIQLVAQRLIAKWNKVVDEKRDVQAANIDMTAFALDVVGLTILGIDLDTLNHPDTQLAKDVLELFRITMVRTLAPFAYWKTPIVGSYLDGFRQGMQRIVETLTSKVRECRKRKANAEIDGTDITSNTFVEKIIDISEGENARFTNQQVVGNLVIILAAATDTSSNTVSFSLWELANDLELQEELYQEVAEYMQNGKKTPNDVTMDDALECFPRIRSFLFEMLRLKGPGPFLFFEPVESMDFLGKKVDPGDILVTAGPAYPHDPNVKSEVPLGPNGEPPTEFCARRWLSTASSEEEKKDDGSNSQRPKLITPSNREAGFLAFGYGLRICPGRMYAHVEMVTIMVHVLFNFHIAAAKDCPKMTLVSRFTETFAEDLKLTLTKRDNGNE